jgi:branched-chain amino acid aminotransferase
MSAMPTAAAPTRPAEYVIYVDGEYLPQSQAMLSVLDHGFMYGDGCFDAYCGKNGYIFKLEEHTRRLYRSMHALRLDVSLAPEEMNQAILECARRNGLMDFYIKVIVSRGSSPEPILDPRKCPKTTVVIYARQLMHERDPEKVKRGIRIKVSAVRRTPHECIEPHVKTCNYLNIIMPKFEAWEAGYDDALQLDVRGYVSEPAGYNIFAVVNGRLITPQNNILEGITRATIIEMARGLGLEWSEGFYTPYDFYTADEVFMTNTVSGITPVGQIDIWPIGRGDIGPVTARLRERYNQMLESGEHGTAVYA